MDSTESTAGPMLLLGGLDDFPFFVVAAVRAGAMRHPQFVTIGTLGKRSRGQMIVRTATIAPRLRMSSFWIWHILTPAPDDVNSTEPSRGFDRIYSGTD